MNISSVSQNFRGYSNPISCTLTAENGVLYSLSVQLDNIGNRDLNEYREIKKMLKFPEKQIECDVLTMTYSQVDGKKDYFFVNDKPILLGPEMAILRDIEFPTNELRDEYKPYENGIIKLYTFLAKITREMKDAKLVLDDDLIKVAKEKFSTLAYLLDNESAAFKAVTDAIEKPVHHKNFAILINRFISKTMEALLL